ncbi:hypothetical protein [Pontibacter fetidus]|uniref:Lipocalin-like domain-containing protein n=1 Tax=Pontibacter fetidus TaxID=2700082 RepID=A0A6B2GYK3_9BACT|nr:hypothetical protein [Pontibacter fetidus]NDK55945.1 hypothetical protein [Pontibacter fetidus]
MTRHQLRYFLCAILFTFMLAGCGKDDDDDNATPNLKYLTDGDWTGDAIYLDGVDVTDEILDEQGFDITEYLLVFERDGSYLERYNGQIQAEGKWEFDNSERIIVYDRGTDDEYSIVISKLDQDEFSFVQSGYEFRFRR